MQHTYLSDLQDLIRIHLHVFHISEYADDRYRHIYLSHYEYETYVNIVRLDSGDIKEKPNWFVVKQISPVIGLNIFIQLVDFVEDLKTTNKEKQIKTAKLEERKQQWRPKKWKMWPVQIWNKQQENWMNILSFQFAVSTYYFHIRYQQLENIRSN